MAFTDARWSTAGTLYSGVGAVGGAFVGLPVGAVIGMGSRCESRAAELGCFVPLVPIALGASLGASAGAALAGESPAWGRTLTGALIGGLVSAVVVIGAEPWGAGTVPLLVGGPALGAYLGNRLGQPRR